MARHGARTHRPGPGPRRARAGLLLLAALLPAIATAATTAPDSLRSAPADSARTAAAVDSARAALAPFRLVPIATLVERGSGPGQAQEPSGLAVDAFSHLLVADAALHRVQWLDAQGRFRSEAGALGSGTGELRAPVGLAPLGSTGWALLDRENHRVLAYDLFGRLTGVLVDLDSDDL